MPEIVIIIWFAMVGGAIGSFLNVVVYRLPNKMSLTKPGSHCPKCSHPIRWYDNIPVFGWGFLGGKCRDCKTPISFRYPFVEGLCALIFALVAALVFIPETVSPADNPTMIWQFAADFGIEKELLLSIFVLIPLSVILTVALVEFDNAQITSFIYVPVAIAQVFVFWLPQLTFWLTGALTGLLLAAVLIWCIPKPQRTNFALAMLSLGCTFGITATIYATIAAIISYIVIRFVANKSLPTLSLLIATVGVMIVCLVMKF